MPISVFSCVQAIYPDSCSLGWPFVPLTKCPVPPEVTMTNITLKDIYINNPTISPGVILGNSLLYIYIYRVFMSIISTCLGNKIISICA